MNAINMSLFVSMTSDVRGKCRGNDDKVLQPMALLTLSRGLNDGKESVVYQSSTYAVLAPIENIQNTPSDGKEHQESTSHDPSPLNLRPYFGT